MNKQPDQITDTTELTVFSELPESFGELVAEKYQQVFSSNDQFWIYFYETPDTSTLDLAVRLGVVLLRLQEPAERLEFLRETFKRMDYPYVTLQNLYTNYPEDTKNMSMYLSCSWLINQSESQQTINESPIEARMEVELLKKIVRAIIPHEEIEAMHPDPTQSGRAIELETKKFKVTIKILSDDGLGDSLYLWFPDYGVEADSTLQAYASETYADEAITPVRILNMLAILNPEIMTEVMSRNSVNTYEAVVENISLSPDTVEKRGLSWLILSKLIRKSAISLHTVDIIPYTGIDKELGIKADYKSLFWLRDTDELSYLLFGHQYQEPSDETALAVFEPRDTPFAAKIFRHLSHDVMYRFLDPYIRHTQKTRYEQSLERFESNFNAVREGYRYFVESDNRNFVFPDGAIPLAVCQNDQYAIGFVPKEEHIEVVIQMNNEIILKQISTESQRVQKQITWLNNKLDAFNKLKQRYTTTDES